MIQRHSSLSRPLQHRSAVPVLRNVPFSKSHGRFAGFRCSGPQGQLNNPSAPQAYPPSHQHEEEGGLSASARHLLSVTALAFFTVIAAVAKERATSPIIPPFLPQETLAVASTHAEPSHTQSTAKAEVPSVAPSSASKPRSRSLLRTLWSTAAAPVKLLDSLLFPEEALVGTPSTKDTPVADSAALAAVATPLQDTKYSDQAATIAADISSSSSTSVVLEPAPSTAAASEALEHLSQQLRALAAAAQVTAGAACSSPTADAFNSMLQRLQAATTSVSVKVQDALAGSAQAAGQAVAKVAAPGAAAAAAQPAAAAGAATLAAVRLMVGPDAMGLAAVVLVTAATAVAGLVLAACIAGLTGLLDSRRRGTTAEQRAAQAALFDSPLRPIQCVTWPGHLPMLPRNMEPIFHRMRDTDADADATPTAASSSYSMGSAAAAGPATTNSGVNSSGSGSTRKEATASAGNPAAAAVSISAAVLGALGVALGPSAAAGLAPMVAVTAGFAAGGLVLASCIAGLAGLLDSRVRGTTPAQRLALYDSPLRPIACYTLPGIVPDLPVGLDPILYRWRNAGSNGNSSSSGSSTAADSGKAAAAAAGSANAATAPAAAAAEEQEWWSFAQIAALRAMPLLPERRRNANSTTTSSSSIAAVGRNAHPQAAASTTAAGRQQQQPGAAGQQGVADEEADAATYATYRAIMAQLDGIVAAAPDGVLQQVEPLVAAHNSLGPPWELAVYLVLAHDLDAAATAEVLRWRAAEGPTQLLADIEELLPAAASLCHMTTRRRYPRSNNVTSLVLDLWALQSRWFSPLSGPVPAISSQQNSNKKQKKKNKQNNSMGSTSAGPAQQHKQQGHKGTAAATSGPSGCKPAAAHPKASSSSSKVQQGAKGSSSKAVQQQQKQAQRTASNKAVTGQRGDSKAAGSTKSSKPATDEQQVALAAIRDFSQQLGWSAAYWDEQTQSWQPVDSESSEQLAALQDAAHSWQSESCGHTEAALAAANEQAAAAALAAANKASARSDWAEGPALGEAEVVAAAKAMAVGQSVGDGVLVNVKNLLGVPVLPEDASSSIRDGQVRDRLSLLLCGPLLMRGDDARAELQAAIRYLAGVKQLDLPRMLEGCMTSVFWHEDWDSPTGVAREALANLKAALPAKSYMKLQQRLMAKGLLKELEVTAEFE